MPSTLTTALPHAPHARGTCAHTHTHTRTHTHTHTPLQSPEKIYNDCDGDMDRIAETMGGIEWKPTYDAPRDARDFAEKILAGSLVRSTTREEGEGKSAGVWKGGDDAPTGK